jgi:hypothetical protein
MHPTHQVIETIGALLQSVLMSQIKHDCHHLFAYATQLKILSMLGAYPIYLSV